MLSASVSARRSQRKHIRGHKQYQEAYKAGVRDEQRHFGDRLVDEVRAHLREREWKLALTGTLVLLRYHPWGILLSERRMERRRLARRLQARREELKACKGRIKELESAQDAQSALAEERQEAQQLRRRIRRLERRMQDLSLWARLRARTGQNGKVRSFAKRFGSSRAKVLGRWRRR
jgi:DNA repair exonuclease SbcCD ATPase subunit